MNDKRASSESKLWESGTVCSTFISFLKTAQINSPFHFLLLLLLFLYKVLWLAAPSALALLFLLRMPFLWDKGDCSVFALEFEILRFEPVTLRLFVLHFTVTCFFIQFFFLPNQASRELLLSQHKTRVTMGISWRDFTLRKNVSSLDFCVQQVQNKKNFYSGPQASMMEARTQHPNVSETLRPNSQPLLLLLCLWVWYSCSQGQDSNPWLCGHEDVPPFVQLPQPLGHWLPKPRSWAAGRAWSHDPVGVIKSLDVLELQIKRGLQSVCAQDQSSLPGRLAAADPAFLWLFTSMFFTDSFF